MFTPEEEKKIDPLIQEPTSLQSGDGILLTPYDLYSNDIPKVTSILPNEEVLKITVSAIFNH